MNIRFFAGTLVINLLLLSFTCSAYKCTLNGQIIRRDSKRLYLVKSTDLKFVNKQIITIINNKFSFTFDVADTEAYELVFEDEYEKSVWNAVIFFPYDGTISFKLYPLDDAQKDEIAGGNLNNDYANYKRNIENEFRDRQKIISEKYHKLSDHHIYYNQERDSLINIMRTKSHEDIDRKVYIRLNEMDTTYAGLTIAGKTVKMEQDSLDGEKVKWRYNYIVNHADILSYYLIYNDAYGAKRNKKVLSAVKAVYPQFAALYLSHPYSQIIADLLNGYNRLSPGQPLIDFTLPDVAGNNHSLKGLTNGKIALIDFWGSWCGPCIAASRTMVPVYNEFRNKGFTVIGIAKEYKTTKDLKIALAREKYAWLNLIELDNKHKVWTKYGITNSTGMMLLVDKDGKVIAVDPTAETVRKEILARL